MTCEFCKRAYEQKPSMRGRSQRFCSRRCAIVARTGVEPGAICSVDGCGRENKQGGLCHGHAYRKREWGDVRAEIPLRTQAPRGSVRHHHGYLVVGGANGHPNANRDGTIRVHRLVMSQMLGRPLLPSESVHHRNGVKTDNRPANLELRIGAHGMGQTVEDRVRDAVSLLSEYAPELLVPAADSWVFWLDREYGPREVAA